jgi:hypothetical protein
MHLSWPRRIACHEFPEHKGERELTNAKGRTAPDETDGDSTEHTGPGVEDADR